MVRAGVVQHPSEWIFGGYTEIQNLKQRYAIINRHELASLLGIKDEVKLVESHNKWVAEILKKGSKEREPKWTESIAVGDDQFVLNTKAKLGAAAIGRKISRQNGTYVLRESQFPYSPVLGLEKCSLSSENSYFWNKCCWKSVT
jgi:putative transposase